VFGDRSVSAEAVEVEGADFVGDMVIRVEGFVGTVREVFVLLARLVCLFAVEGRCEFCTSSGAERKW